MNESYPWDDPKVMIRDLKEAIADIEASGGPKIFGEDS